MNLFLSRGELRLTYVSVSVREFLTLKGVAVETAGIGRSLRMPQVLSVPSSVLTNRRY